MPRTPPSTGPPPGRRAPRRAPGGRRRRPRRRRASRARRPASPATGGTPPSAPRRPRRACGRAPPTAAASSPRSRCSRPISDPDHAASRPFPAASARRTDSSSRSQRGPVVRAVREVHPLERVDGGQLRVALRHRLRRPQPALGPLPHPRLHVDVAQLAAGGDAAGAVLRPLRHGDRLVEHGGALLVAPPARVDEGGAERDERLGAQRAVAAGGGLRARAAQPVDRRLDRARGGGRLAGLDLPAGGGAPARRRRPRRRVGGVGGAAHRRRGVHAELLHQDRVAAVGLGERAGPVARQGEAADQQLVMALVQRVERDGAGGEPHRVVRAAGGEGGEGRLVQHRLARRRLPAPLHGSHASKPGLESNDRPSSSSPPASSGDGARASTTVPGGSSSTGGSPRSASGRPRARRSSARLHRSAPSGSSASGKSRAASSRRPTGLPLSSSVGQQPPRLSAARRGHGDAVARDRRGPEETDRQRHRAPSSYTRWPGRHAAVRRAGPRNIITRA